MTTTVDFGIDCQPTTTAFVNHYWVQFPSEETYLISNKIALGNGSLAQNWLTFDYAYSDMLLDMMMDLELIYLQTVELAGIQSMVHLDQIYKQLHMNQAHGLLHVEAGK